MWVWPPELTFDTFRNQFTPFAEQTSIAVALDRFNALRFAYRSRPSCPPDAVASCDFWSHCWFHIHHRFLHPLPECEWTDLFGNFRFVIYFNLIPFQALLFALCHITVSGLSNATCRAAAASCSNGEFMCVFPSLYYLLLLPSKSKCSPRWYLRSPRRLPNRSASPLQLPTRAKAKGTHIACWPPVHWSHHSGRPTSPPSPRRRSSKAKQQLPQVIQSQKGHLRTQTKLCSFQLAMAQATAATFRNCPAMRRTPWMPIYQLLH